ncbi:hypothetical protein PHYSODRAFT_530717 [Phytophthora sojae]|uniref:Retroviral polymerase SH3-like domain-containing protein n=1 Tax=Phytophthora sojae (strain P6497) TaxID=1094619 RepID=G5ABE5_PHYSP|nr:hypothetical protein PHYSODRAFT_530717 [Phytophthora sojae]EGZ06670.1 hypothetical protein PHYSODRAFT_530717 [Phytophthora sojae]|eukprot:XP_009537434.1 hypothetical protein PHYSODRAFT_530717 [Phytophthora sojae]
MHAADLPQKLWPEVLRYVVDIDNMTATRALRTELHPALLLGFARSTTGYRLLHLRTGNIVEARDLQFREDATVSSKYLNKLLMGRHQGEKIPYVPLPVEYIATDNERDGADRAVENSLPKEVTPSHGGSAVMDDAHGPGGATSSSSAESEVGEVHNTRAIGHGAVPAHGSAQPLASGRR